MIEKKESPFKELSHAISIGDIRSVHAWFRDSGFESDKSLREQLCKHIVNEPYFFSFSSNLFDRYSLQKESLKRELPVLSYFNLKEQLSILSSVSLDKSINIEHFKVLNYSKNIKTDKDTVLKDLGIHHLFTSLFNQENFDLMHKIEERLSLDIKSHRMDKIAIHYDYPNKGAFYLNNKKYNTCPLDDIIFNYSKVKENYLKAHNIELPNFDYVNELKEKILEEIKTSPYFNAQGYNKKVEDKIENYFINYRYELLNNSIVSKPEGYKKSKKI